MEVPNSSIDESYAEPNPTQSEPNSYSSEYDSGFDSDQSDHPVYEPEVLPVEPEVEPEIQFEVPMSPSSVYGFAELDGITSFNQSDNRIQYPIR